MTADDREADLALLQRWCGGDRRAGEALCARYFDEIYGFFAHKIPGEADDLTQQTFMRCVRARSQFAGRSTFRTYLFTIARNQLITRLRELPRHAHVDLETSSLDELVASPSSELREHEERALVRAALRRLPVEQQILLELHYWHELDAAALAELLETSPGTIRVRLVRARQALRERLGTPAAVPGMAIPPGDRLWRSLHEPDPDEA